MTRILPLLPPSARWYALSKNSWKLNFDAAWNPISLVGGWGSFKPIYDIRLASFKSIQRCNAVKILEATTIYEALNCIMSLNIHHILVTSNCLEVINLLNDPSMDLTNISFFIDEAQSLALEMCKVYFSHVQCCHNLLAHSLVNRALWLGHWKSNLGLLILWSRCNSLVGFVIHFLKKLSKYDTNFQVMDKNVVEEIPHWKIKKPHNLYNINRLFLSFPIDFTMESNEFLPNNKLVCILVLMSWP